MVALSSCYSIILNVCFISKTSDVKIVLSPLSLFVASMDIDTMQRLDRPSRFMHECSIPRLKHLHEQSRHRPSYNTNAVLRHQSFIKIPAMVKLIIIFLFCNMR